MSTEESEKAELACGACKRLKRKCDRVLPECGLCSRTRRYCDYTPATIPGPSGQDFAALTARLGELEALVSSPLTRQQTDNVLHASHVPSTASSSTNDQDKAAGAQFPAALFLDVDCFKWAGMRLPTPSIDIPAVRLPWSNAVVLLMRSAGNSCCSHTWRHSCGYFAGIL